MHTDNFLHCIRITEHYIAKSKIIFYNLTQIQVHGFGILVNKSGSNFFSQLPVFRLTALEHQRDIFILFSYGCQEPDTCLWVYDSITQVPSIANNT